MICTRTADNEGGPRLPAPTQGHARVPAVQTKVRCQIIWPGPYARDQYTRVAPGGTLTHRRA